MLIYANPRCFYFYNIIGIIIVELQSNFCVMCNFLKKICAGFLMWYFVNIIVFGTEVFWWVKLNSFLQQTVSGLYDCNFLDRQVRDRDKTETFPPNETRYFHWNQRSSEITTSLIMFAIVDFRNHIVFVLGDGFFAR